jgi:hypothetical protein
MPPTAADTARAICPAMGIESMTSAANIWPAMNVTTFASCPPTSADRKTFKKPMATFSSPFRKVA